ncbi:hypothetical protein [Haliscomenobacter sp.]|uniref:hypothetical protein n=1 Tax=Haliscomenobacter sp. TaxID=2717303 RepID=UPI003364E222
MNSFTIEIFDADSRMVTYYTVRWENQELSETDKFFEQFSEQDYYKESFEQLVALLELIGEYKGALPVFFTRHEDEATAIPPSYVHEFDLDFQGNVLRLYCVRICKSIVILFNGGLKSARTAQDSENLSSKFRDAKYFARKIFKEIKDGMIEINESNHSLRSFDGNEEIIIF